MWRSGLIRCLPNKSRFAVAVFAVRLEVCFSYLGRLHHPVRGCEAERCQAFDEGWLTDGRGKRVYLSDAVVIMTSNVGSENFRRLTSPLGFLNRSLGIEQVQGEILRELERRFTPEFRNRIDEVVLFSPLTHDEVREIARMYLEKVMIALARAGKTIQVSDEALELIVTNGHNMAFGARFLKRYIDEHVKLPISERWKEGSHFDVLVRDGQLVVEPNPARVLSPGGVLAFGDVA